MTIRNAPPRPLLVYDGECGFCRRWVGRWNTILRERVDFAPFQEVADRFPEIPREEFARAVQLVTPAGEVFSGAEAVFRALACVPGKGWMFWVYRNVPGAAASSEWFYGFVARHRSGLS